MKYSTNQLGPPERDQLTLPIDFESSSIHLVQLHSCLMRSEVRKHVPGTRTSIAAVKLEPTGFCFSDSCLQDSGQPGELPMPPFCCPTRNCSTVITALTAASSQWLCPVHPLQLYRQPLLPQPPSHTWSLFCSRKNCADLSPHFQ